MPKKKSKPKKTVKVYTTPTCPYCNYAKDFLKENNINYKEIDVTKNKEAARELFQVSGQLGVPVILVGDEIVIGFDREYLTTLLKKEGFKIKTA